MNVIRDVLIPKLEMFEGWARLEMAPAPPDHFGFGMKVGKVEGLSLALMVLRDHDGEGEEPEPQLVIHVDGPIE